MKKIFSFVALGLALVGCKSFGPEQTYVDEVAAGTVTVGITAPTDNSVAVTVEAPEGTSYYSYVVVEGEIAEADLSPEYVYHVAYGSSDDYAEAVVAEGTQKYADKSSLSFVIERGISENAKYTVYAVCASSTGTPGEVASKSVVTSDRQAPEWEGRGQLTYIEGLGNLYLCLFSEEIVKGSGDITLKYYALNDPGFEPDEEDGTVEPTGVVTIKNAYILTEEDVLAFLMPDLPAGAYYSISWPEGLVTDLCGNKCEAMESECWLNTETYLGDGEGVWDMMENNTFKIGESDIKKVADWETSIAVEFGSDYGYGYAYKTKIGKVTYENNRGNKKVELDIVPNTDVWYSSSAEKLVMELPEAPEKGDKITISIPAGAFEDYFGNTNEAWELTYYYSFEYDIESISGTYPYVYINALTGQLDQSILMLADLSDEEKASFAEKELPYNVKLTAFHKIMCAKPIYAYLDTVRGSLTIPSGQQFVKLSNGYILMFYVYQASSVTLYVSETGGISYPTEYFGAVVLNEEGTSILGFYTLYANFVAQKYVPASYGEEEGTALTSMPMLDLSKIYPMTSTPVVPLAAE